MGRRFTQVPIVALDDIFNLSEANIVLVVDVEGHEIEVLRGARRLLARNNVIVIFEYTDETKAVFSMADVEQLLGKAYLVRRLTDSGHLDDALEHTWNCVAFKAQSEETLLRRVA